MNIAEIEELSRLRTWKRLVLEALTRYRDDDSAGVFELVHLIEIIEEENTDE